MRYWWAFAIWLCIVPIAILNGGLRQYVLDVYLGGLSNPLSGVLLSLCIVAVALWLVPKVKRCRRVDYVLFGVMWMVLTNLFDLCMILQGGGTMADFVVMYDVTTGNLWALVVLTSLVAPILAGLRKSKEYEV